MKVNIDLPELLSLRPHDFDGRRILTEEHFLHWFSLLDASWVHNGDPKMPHAILTSGKCSNGFFDCLRVLKYMNLSEILANRLARKILAALGPEKIDWVIGSPMAGITFAKDVARFVGAKKMFFVEKHPTEEGKMLWNRGSAIIEPGETVLQIEELVTTAKTLNAVKAAIDLGNPTPVNWLPVVGILVHRPENLKTSRYYDDARLAVSLIEKEIWAKDPSECPLCRQGSPRLKPKSPMENWAILTGKKKME